MFDVGDKVIVWLRGEPHAGVVRKIKFGMGYVEFRSEIKNDWYELRRMRKDNAIYDTDTR